MRCPDCNKFVSYDDSNEPEINSEELAKDGSISIEASIVLTCAECGTELKGADFEFTPEVDDDAIKAHTGDGHSLELIVEGQELTSRQEGAGRYAKTFYGVSVEAKVMCECGEEVFSETLKDDVQASSMDELT